MAEETSSGPPRHPYLTPGGPRLRPFTAAFIIGLAGLVTGYLAPLHFEPSSPQGPLVGTVFSGPLGAFAGLVLGVVAELRDWRSSRFTAAVLVAAVALVAATTWLCLPQNW